MRASPTDDVSPEMYLTAQHVKASDGREDVHAYLHLHDRGGIAFPAANPLSVPTENPGRIVRQSSAQSVRAGGNQVLAYLDIIGQDRMWEIDNEPVGHGRSGWLENVRVVGELMAGKPLPWVVEAGEVYLVMNASSHLDPTSEFAEVLLPAALSLWESWRSAP